VTYEFTENKFIAKMSFEVNPLFLLVINELLIGTVAYKYVTFFNELAKPIVHCQ